MLEIALKKYGAVSAKNKAAAANLSGQLPALVPLLGEFDLVLRYKQTKSSTPPPGPSPLKDLRELLPGLPDDILVGMKEIASQIVSGSSLESAIQAHAAKLAAAAEAAAPNAQPDKQSDAEAERLRSAQRCAILRKRARALVAVAKSERSRRRDAELIVRKSHRVIRRHRDGMGELRRRLAKALSERDRFNSYFTAQMNVAGRFKAKLVKEEGRAYFADLNTEQMRAELEHYRRRQGRAHDWLPSLGIKEWIRSGLSRH